jgi:predicted DNA-binding transcriptional regulator AlpA
MLIRKGVKLLEEQEGDGDVVQRQREYMLSIRLTLNQGEIVASPVVFSRPDLRQREDGFFDYRTRISREWLIPGLLYTLQGMRIGGYRKVAISPHLAYGDKGIPDTIPPNAVLIAEIRVVEKVEKAVPKKKRREPEVTEVETLTQDQLCQRYQIDRLTLWRRRKDGHLPAPILMGRTVRWRLSTIEEWEANGRPRVSPSLHEEEIDLNASQMHDLMLELALLIDEAGQWYGPPLERLLNNEDAAIHQWGNVRNILEPIPVGQPLDR